MKNIFYTSLFLFSVIVNAQQLPKGFSYLEDIAPTIQRELRYCSHNNFIGIPIDGYEEDILITSTKTAYALKNQMEYFADLSAMYFVGGNYFPYNAELLKEYDNQGLNMVKSLWY